jgi:hypothetical protein
MVKHYALTPLDQALLCMKFLDRTILHLSTLKCFDGNTCVCQVSEMTHINQELDVVWFNIDEIFVVLQMFYFQTQDGLVYKKVTSVIEDIVRPMTNPSQIDHKELTVTVIRKFKEYDSTTAYTVVTKMVRNHTRSVVSRTTLTVLATC